MKSVMMFALFVLADGCGPSEVGEECGDPGSRGDCVEGAICVRQEDAFGREEILCRRLCPTGDECDESSECSFEWFVEPPSHLCY